MKFGQWGGVVGLALLQQVSCGALAGEEEDGVSAATKDQFLAAYADWSCELLIECSATEATLLGREDCARDLEQRVHSSFTWNSPTVGYDAAMGEGCLRALDRLACTDLTSFDVAEPCGQVLVGDAASGAPCEVSQQCQGGLYCDTSQACPGICRVLPGQSEPCPTFQCAPGLSCITSSSLVDDGRCETRGAQGVACGDNLRDCQAGLACDALDGGQGTCLPVDSVYPKVSLGEPCHSSLQCGAEQYCSTTPEGGQVCAAVLSSGASCESPAAQCPANHYCDFGATLTCRPRLPEGAACDGDGFACQVGECIDGTCQLQRELGAPCTEDAACYSYLCEAGVCAIRPPCL